MSQEPITLCAGVTGFYRRGDFVPVGVSLAAFERELTERLRRTSWSVLVFEPDGVCRSFHRARIQRRGGGAPIQLLLNPYARILAAATEVDEAGWRPCAFEFLPVPPDVERACPDDWRAARPVELDRALQPSDLVVLRPVEMKQVRYWQPETLADVLFSYWD